MKNTTRIALAVAGAILAIAALTLSPAPVALDDKQINELQVDQIVTDNQVIATARSNTTAVRSALADSSDNSATLHPVWLIESISNRVYLMGSVHVLRKSDYPLPEVFQQAYNDAEQLVMELGIEEIGNISNFAYMRRIAMLPEEQTLADNLGKALYDELASSLAKQSIKLSMFDRVEPWYAAMTITQILMQRLGYKAMYGIEMHFVNQAMADNKPGHGLETAVEQFDMLDGLSQETQVKFLQASVLSPEELAADGEKLINAWRIGDIAELETMFEDDMDDNPELENVLLAERNRRWLPKIEALTDSEDDYLVIVGALHLVGEHGVIELLRQRGYTVTQL